MTAQLSWVRGACWLWCERRDILVTPIGYVPWKGEELPTFACAACVARLRVQVRHALAAPTRQQRAPRRAAAVPPARITASTIRVGDHVHLRRDRPPLRVAALHALRGGGRRLYLGDGTTYELRPRRVLRGYRP